MTQATNQFPAIADKTIGGETVQTVNARDLHSFLQARRDFSNWIKDRINQYGFVENSDYVKFEDLSSPNLASSKSRAQRAIEYALTLDMAKELAMVERNELGKQVRRYFIQCERVAREALRVAATASPANHLTDQRRRNIINHRKVAFAKLAAELADLGTDPSGYDMRTVVKYGQLIANVGKLF